MKTSFGELGDGLGDAFPKRFLHFMKKWERLGYKLGDKFVGLILGQIGYRIGGEFGYKFRNQLRCKLFDNLGTKSRDNFAAFILSLRIAAFAKVQVSHVLPLCFAQIGKYGKRIFSNLGPQLGG